MVEAKNSIEIRVNSVTQLAESINFSTCSCANGNGGISAENLITDLYTLIADEDAWTCNDILTCLLATNEQQSSSSGLVWAEVLSHCFNLLE